MSIENPPFAILQYQRIIDPAVTTYPIPRPNLVKPTTFERHLRFLTSSYHVLDLETAINAFRKGERLPKRSVVLTFDGGWIDTFVYAFPALYDLGLTATVFLHTDFINTNGYLWNDMVLFALESIKAAGGKFVPFTFFNEELCKAIEEVSPGGIITPQLIGLVVMGLAAATRAERILGVKALCVVAAEIGGILPVEPAFMGWEEISIMSGGGIKFGSMGRSNELFHDLDEKQSITEVEASYQDLRGKIGNLSKVFCFPEGEPGSFGLKAAKLAKADAAVGLSEPLFEVGEAGALPFYRRIAISETVAPDEEALAKLLEASAPEVS